MEPALHRLIDTLAGEKGATAFMAQLGRRADEMNTRQVAALAAAVAAAADSHPDEVDTYAYIYDSVRSLLIAAPGPESLRRLLHLPTALRPDAELRAAELLAEELADTRSADELADTVFTGPLHRPSLHELRVCLLQELVLRSVQINEIPHLAAFAASPAAAQHPLGRLPATLLAVERGVAELVTAEQHLGWPTPLNPYRRADAAERSPAPHTGGAYRLAEVRDPAQRVAIGTAVQHWSGISNARITAQIFAVNREVDPHDIDAVFAGLPLECAPEGAGTLTPLLDTTATTALCVLFLAASSGGAYGGRRGNGYARLAAWESMAALAGTPAAAPFADLAAQAEETHWYLFDTQGPWFYRVAWDVTMAALRPGRRELAVLAATDTD
ncbi:hypothetical protein DR950_01565 [Kitasatospora xanthocidica]|uniref:Uncharacterized protein n=1 Tax=Kitasatospora xanthocidica TaxID=83382 RepID=A0A372ZLD7_9ACTN|nr:DUF6183 family protein [Kitasatospora xanthocidica]RGD56656.1 hypothetical protein DR950_01565 [Kitasatospora xanthocidica]